MLKSKLFGDKSVVPMVMFHSVGAENLDWIYRHVSCPVAPFEEKLRVLKQAGFNFIFWSDLYEYMAGRRALELPAIVLTFDDGYLDNWVHVFPILQKYSIKATIFVSADFIDPSKSPRPTAAGMALDKAAELQVAGFLNFAEMRAMEASGLVDIQSHAKTHTWWFCGDKVIDFWRPGLRQYPWMAWNARPDRKIYYMDESQEALVPYGTPVYEHGKALGVTRYLPAPEIQAELAEYVAQNGGAGFFERSSWLDELRTRHDLLSAKYSVSSRYESERERAARIYEELVESKRVLEEGLSKRVEFICWPGGGYDAATLDMARKAGYKSWTLASSDQGGFRNIPNVDNEQVKRIGDSIHQHWRSQAIGYTNGYEFFCAVRRHQGSIFHKWFGRALRTLRIAKHYLRRGGA